MILHVCPWRCGASHGGFTRTLNCAHLRFKAMKCAFPSRLLGLPRSLRGADAAEAFRLYGDHLVSVACRSSTSGSRCPSARRSASSSCTTCPSSSARPAGETASQRRAVRTEHRQRTTFDTHRAGHGLRARRSGSTRSAGRGRHSAPALRPRCFMVRDRWPFDDPDAALAIFGTCCRATTMAGTGPPRCRPRRQQALSRRSHERRRYGSTPCDEIQRVGACGSARSWCVRRERCYSCRW